MFNSTTARIGTVDSTLVETEIALINLNIIQAVKNDQVTANVDVTTQTIMNGVTITGTPITLEPNYYLVWQQTITNNKLTSHMNSVIDNFSKLGYTISRKTKNGQNISWQISW